MTDRELVEEILYEYPLIKSKLAMKSISLVEFPFKGISYSDVKVQTSNKIFSDVEKYVLNKIDYDQEFVLLWKKANMIEGALLCLTSREKRVVELYYFDNLSEKEIAEEIDVSRNTITNIRNTSLDKLKEVGLLINWAKIGQNLCKNLAESNGNI